MEKESCNGSASTPVPNNSKSPLGSHEKSDASEEKSFVSYAAENTHARSDICTYALFEVIARSNSGWIDGEVA
jgi:hypothetical protein